MYLSVTALKNCLTLYAEWAGSPPLLLFLASHTQKNQQDVSHFFALVYKLALGQITKIHKYPLL